MGHRWHTGILISCIAAAAVIQAIDQALAQSTHFAVKLPGWGWLNYLPLAFLLLAGVLWIALILRPKSPPQAQTAKNLELVKPTQPPSRLKIISAHYGVEGISYPEVTRYLLERLHGNAFAEPIVADLFHGFDPVSGNPHKLLKVRYSFDGKEATITRPEYAMLILPEDTFLKDQVEQCQRERKLNENQLNAELWRAQEARKQCEAERREALGQVDDLKQRLAMFSPLQIEALIVRKRLIEFLEELGPEPTCDTSDCLNDPTMNARKVSQWHREFNEFQTRFTALYAVRFRQSVVELYHRFALAGVRDTRFAALSDKAESVRNVHELTEMLWRIAGEINSSYEESRTMLGRTTQTTPRTPSDT